MRQRSTVTDTVSAFKGLHSEAVFVTNASGRNPDAEILQETKLRVLYSCPQEVTNNANLRYSDFLDTRSDKVTAVILSATAYY